MEKVDQKEMAKLAAKAIRDLDAKNKMLTATNAAQSEKLATLTKERECYDLAKKMAEDGLIDRSFESVEKTAHALMDKDLSVVKEAMTLAPSLPSLGEPVPSRTGASGEDNLVETILELAR